MRAQQRTACLDARQHPPGVVAASAAIRIFMAFSAVRDGATVHLDDGPRCALRVALAAHLAARFESRLVGVAPTGVADVILSLNSAVPDNLELLALSAACLRKRADAVAQAFDAQCKVLDVSAESRVVMNEAVDAMIEHGRSWCLRWLSEHFAVETAKRP